MTFSLPRRSALIVVLTVCLQLVGLAGLAGCSSTPKEEPANTTAERLYKDAREDMESGSYDRAIKSLERVEGLAAGSLLAQQALLDIAYINWRQSEKAQALNAVDRFIKLNPSSPALDYALYLRGVINFNDNLGLLGDLGGQDLSERDQRASRDSYQDFRQLLDRFPTSVYADDARQRMNYIVGSLAAYEVHVANYYLRRGAYLAAANRAQGAITEFPQTKAVEEALHILMLSYDKLELTQLRDDAGRVLRQNFPHSSYLDSDPVANDKSWWKFW
jgi:outer membrane protein assembly factor BamD